MSEIIPFNFEQHEVRAITDRDGEPWFIAKDVAEVLGYSDTEAMTRRLDDDEVRNLQIVGFGNRGVNVINESGLYSATLGSTKPEAKPFKRWVTKEVLPTIRKTGSYTAPAATKANPKTALQPAKEFRALYGIARMIGLDKNAAAISANQAVAKITDTNVLGLLDASVA